MSSETPKGVIYDQGYQRYEGHYLGRGYAIWSLTASDLKRALGIKKSVWYKVFLWFFFFVIAAQAIVFFFINYLATRLGPEAPSALTNPHSALFDGISIFLLFLGAMVAPDLLCSDRRFKVLSLYLVRPIELYDYLLAKGLTIFGFLTLVALVPQLAIFVARAFTATDAIKYVTDHTRDLGALFASSLLYAAFYTSLAMAFSSLTSQRAYATGAIIAIPILLGFAASLLLVTTQNQYWQLLALGDLPGSVKNALFGVSYGAIEPLEPWIYLLALGAVISLSLSVALFSYAKERS